MITPTRLGELLDMPPDEAIAFALARGVTPTDELPVDDAAVEALLREI